MSVPANLMQQMLKQQGGARPGAPAAAPGGAPPPQGGQSDAARAMPPAAAPFATPQDKRGLKATAIANVHIARQLLRQALPDLGHESAEGMEVTRAINGLTKITGEQDHSDLVPAEIMQLVKSMPQMGGGTQVQQELARQQQEKMMQQRAAMQQASQGQGGGQPRPPGV